MTILKLPNEGDHYTGHVAECSVEAGKYGEQVKFGFANGDILYIGKPTADRQLLRAGFDAGGTPPQVDYQGVVGNTLAFTRDHNKTAPDKPYWGISVATAADKAPPAPSKRLAGPTTVPGEAPAASDPKRAVAGLTGALPTPARTNVNATRVSKDDVAAAYEWAWGMAGKIQTDGDGATNIAATQAGAATLLIALQKENLVAGFSLVRFEDVKAALDLEAPMPSDDDYGLVGGEESLPF